MRKIPYNDFVRSMTMFFINEDIDNRYFRLREGKLDSLVLQLRDIGTREGLVQYVQKYDDSLENLLVLLGISTELFKRIISLFRIDRGMEFKTEWSIDATRSFILKDNAMMEKVCDLFLKGAEDPYLCKKISKYRLKGFVINERVIERIKNKDFMDFLISKDFDTAYNSDVSQINIKLIDGILKDICKRGPFELNSNCSVDPVGNRTQNIQVNYIINGKSIQNPLYYIKYSFNVTTSRGQTDFKRSVQNLRAYIKDKNPDAKQIIIVDGAGWVGRQSDLHDVWDYSDYCLNLKNIDELKNIIK